MPRRHALHNYCPADGPTDRFLIAFPFALPSRRFRSLLEKASCTPPTTASSCLSDDSAPPLPGSHRPVRCTACLLNERPVRICVPLLTRPWVMQACHSTAFPATPAPRALCECSNVLPIGMNICTRWWLRNCLECQSCTNNLAAEGPLAHHLDAPARRARRRHQHRLLRPSSSHTSR